MPIENRVETPKAVKGWATHDSSLGTFAYDLNNLYSPDNTLGQSCVLDLASPKYNTNSTYIYDKSGKGNHGTIIGATWERLPSGAFTQYFTTDDFIRLGTSTILQVGKSDFTIISWINPVTGNPDASGILSRGSYQADGFEFGIHSGVLYYQTNQAGVATTYHGLTAVTQNTYSLATICRNGNNLIFSLDAITDAPVVVTAEPLDNAARQCLVGVTSSTFWKGYIRAVRILNRASSATQIAGIFNQERHLFGV
jgi:hypothetical protein